MEKSLYLRCTSQRCLILVFEKKKDTVSVCNNCIVKLDAAAVQFIVETLKIMIMKTKKRKTLSNDFNEKCILLLKERIPCAPNYGPM